MGCRSLALGEMPSANRNQTDFRDKGKHVCESLPGKGYLPGGTLHQAFAFLCRTLPVD
jgi:hypothetical protein